VSGPQRDSTWRVAGFDGLRACAAILVVAYHSASSAGASLSGPLAPFAALLKAGVVIFFVISGFVLYLPYARAIRSGRAIGDWRRFASRRAARILPGYWVALTVLAAAALVAGVFGPNWWRFYGLTQIYDPSTAQQGLRVAWSLAVEVSFYLLLPFVAWGLHRAVRARSRAAAVRIQLWVMALVAVWSLAIRMVAAQSLVFPVPANHLTLVTSIAGMADWFALGICLAVLRAEWESGSGVARRLEALGHRAGLCWLLAAVAYLVAVPAQHGEYFLPSYGVVTHLAVGLAAALFVLPAVVPARARRRNRPMALLCSPIMIWLGTISYGLYLWHQPFRDLIDGWLGAPQGALAFGLLFVLTLAGGIALGAASWYLVERPAQAWARARERRQLLPEPVARPDELLPAGDVSTAVKASIPLS
jgi:peptidoglycan/LPS O-acetylase OafA/YrhL